MKTKLEGTPELHLGSIPRSQSFNTWSALKHSATGSEKKVTILSEDLHLKSGGGGGCRSKRFGNLSSRQT